MSWTLDLDAQLGATPGQGRLRPQPLGNGSVYQLVLPLRCRGYAAVASEHPRARARQQLSKALEEALCQDGSLGKHETIPKIHELRGQIAATRRKHDLTTLEIAELDNRCRRLRLEMPDGFARTCLDLQREIEAAKADLAAADEELAYLTKMEQEGRRELQAAVDAALARAGASVRQRFVSQAGLARADLEVWIDDKISSAVDALLVAQECADPLFHKECMSQLGSTIAGRTVAALLASPAAEQEGVQSEVRAAAVEDIGDAGPA